MPRGMIYIFCASPIDVCHNDGLENYIIEEFRRILKVL